MIRIEIRRSGKWTDDAADEFEYLSKCAQWKELQAVVVDYKQVGGDSGGCGGGLVPVVELVDSSAGEDLNIGRELIRLGHAREARIVTKEDGGDD